MKTISKTSTTYTISKRQVSRNFSLQQTNLRGQLISAEHVQMVTGMNSQPASK